MQLGMIGLGRMGASRVRRLLRSGHACVVHDGQASTVAGLVTQGATGAASLEEMVSQLDRPRTIWLMVPAAVVDRALLEAVPLLAARLQREGIQAFAKWWGGLMARIREESERGGTLQAARSASSAGGA